MMPPYPEKALLAGRHFCSRCMMQGSSGRAHTLFFTALRGPVRLLKICKSTIFAN
jgi:hypothetical protein